MSCATILASELDFPEAPLEYPSYAAVLSRVLEVSIAFLTAEKSSRKNHRMLQGSELAFVESDNS